MTHDELLAKVDTLEARYTDYPTYVALRAVVELHKPEDRYQNEKDFYCSVCFVEGDPYEEADEVRYPCPTIQAIEKELK